jgi:hypothetical protein
MGLVSLVLLSAKCLASLCLRACMLSSLPLSLTRPGHPGRVSPTKGTPISPTKGTVNIHFSEPSAAAPIMPIASRRELATSNGLPGLLPAKRSRKAVGSVGGLWIEQLHMRHPHSKHGLSSSPPGVLNMLPVVGNNIMSPQSHGLQAGVAPEGGGEAAGKTLGGVSPAHTHAGLPGRGRKPSTAPVGAHESDRDGVIAGGQAARSMLKSGGGPIFTVLGDGNTSAVIPLITGASAVQGEREKREGQTNYMHRQMLSPLTITPQTALPWRPPRPPLSTRHATDAAHHTLAHLLLCWQHAR